MTSDRLPPDAPFVGSSEAQASSMLDTWNDHPAVTRISDEAMAAAYESVDARERAWLKLTIARIHAFWGDRRERCARVREFPQGFSAREEEAPAALALFVCDPALPSAAHLTAGVMPAVLAGAECLVCFPSASSALPAAPLLVGLELAGVESCCIATPASVCDRLSALSAAAAQIRIVFPGQPAGMEEIALRALRLGMPCRILRDNAALMLDAAHEGIWFWPDLEPGWFRSRRLFFNSAVGQQCD